MGYGTWTSADWKTYATSSITGKTTEQIYTSTAMKPEFNPKGVTRESRDSEDHPNATPIIIGLDVTGSMSSILNEVAQQLGTLVQEILDRKPVSDPQIMFNAIGDCIYDDAPFQTTQFESDIRIAEQLTQLWFEQGGGGNNSESYTLAWWNAANHTETDQYDKRGKKGFLFTMGDEECPESVSKKHLKAIFGDDVEQNEVSAEEMLTQVNRKYEVFHLCLEEGWHMQHCDARSVRESWRKMLGERAIMVSDYRKIPHIIVSILETMAGKSVDEVAASWDGSTAVVVREALNGLTAKNETADLVEF